MTSSDNLQEALDTVMNKMKKPNITNFNKRIAISEVEMSYVDLFENEKHMYHGCGWAYLKINVDGGVEQIDYVANTTNNGDTLRAQFELDLARRLEDGEWIIAMLSCFQICRPLSLLLSAGRDRAWKEFEAEFYF